MSVGPEVKEKAGWKISSDTGYTRMATFSNAKKFTYPVKIGLISYHM